MTGLDDIVRAIDISAPPERVWTVMTAEGLVEAWLGCIGYRPQVGALFYMQPDAARRADGDVTGATHCRVLALEPPRRMAFSWFLPGTPETIVELTVEATATGSRVTLTHAGWDQFDAEQVRAIRDQLAGGWGSFVLPGLKAAAEA